MEKIKVGIVGLDFGVSIVEREILTGLRESYFEMALRSSRR